MSDEEQDEQVVKQKPNKWKCPECGQKVTFYVEPSAPPTCASPTAHPKKTVKMVRL